MAHGAVGRLRRWVAYTRLPLCGGLAIDTMVFLPPCLWIHGPPHRYAVGQVGIYISGDNPTSRPLTNCLEWTTLAVYAHH